jgi:acyl-CoA thioester hydrolase
MGGDPFYRVNVRVHWADTDAAGVVWFGNFFRFFEEAEDELFRALGRTRMDLARDLGILMPRVEASCRFRSPARPEEVLEVGIAVESLTARRINYRFDVREQESQRPVADGRYSVACILAGTFKGVEVPLPLRELVGGMGRLIAQQQDGGARRPEWT